MISNSSRRLLTQPLNQKARWCRHPLLPLDPSRRQQPRPNPFSLLSTSDLHTFALAPRREKEEEQQKKLNSRLYHSTAPSERAVAAIMGLATISAVGYAAASAAKSYEEWKAAQPSPEELEEMRKAEEAERKRTGETEKPDTEATSKDQKQDDSFFDGPRENIFKKFFDVGTKYYEGGFEETMTKREAALILGVRESASPQRIKDAHRKLLILNHPDTGGSNYISGKINEAKELLLKGRSQRV